MTEQRDCNCSGSFRRIITSQTNCDCVLFNLKWLWNKDRDTAVCACVWDCLCVNYSATGWILIRSAHTVVKAAPVSPHCFPSSSLRFGLSLLLSPPVFNPFPFACSPLPLLRSLPRWVRWAGYQWWLLSQWCTTSLFSDPPTPSRPCPEPRWRSQLMTLHKYRQISHTDAHSSSVLIWYTHCRLGNDYQRLSCSSVCLFSFDINSVMLCHQLQQLRPW